MLPEQKAPETPSKSSSGKRKLESTVYLQRKWELRLPRNCTLSIMPTLEGGSMITMAEDLIVSLLTLPTGWALTLSATEQEKESGLSMTTVTMPITHSDS